MANNRCGDNGLFMLKLGLLANRSLEKLNLANIKMTCEGNHVKILHLQMYHKLSNSRLTTSPPKSSPPPPLSNLSPLLPHLTTPFPPPSSYNSSSVQYCLFPIFTGAIALAEVLAESKHLVELDLKENDIRVAGLMALQLAHRMNRSLIAMETPKSYRVEQVVHLM